MKKAGIMQPYFFPYVGYLSLIKHTDEFILFDTAQFIRHGWIERNRILKQGEGWLYVKVPLTKHKQDILIKDISIDNRQNWKNTLFSQLQVYKKTAPYYRQVEQLITQLFTQDFSDIVSLNKAALEAVCAYLSIHTPIRILSAMNLTIVSANAPDEWALRICQAMGDVDEYWNPPGGQEFFNAAKYREAGIALRFQKPLLDEYDQRRQPFEPGLSIIDAMMFNSPEVVNEMLDHYELI